jgi:hypothetical protein
MTAALAAIAPQLGKVVRLLASDRDGEVVAAARAIGRILRSNGLDWHDFAQALCPDNQRDWHDTLAFCAAHMGALNSRERDFLRGIARQRSDLTPKQRDWLESIAAKLWAGC